MSARLSDLAVNTKARALGQLLDGGWLVLEAADGTELLRVRFAAPAFEAPEKGVLRARAMTSQAATAEGNASTCCAYRADGTTEVFRGTVGTKNATVILRSLAVSKGAVLALSGMTLTEPRE